MTGDKLYDKIERLATTLDRMRLDEYLDYMSDRGRMYRQALVGGILRGVGFSIGFSVISALVVTLLRHIVVENIPGIGSFLAEVVHAIEERSR